MGLDGNVVVLTDPDALNVTVEYDIVSSAPDTVSFSVDDDEGVVRLRAPHSRECVTAHITLTLPSTLQSLSITTSTLPIELRDSVTLSTLAVFTSHGSLISHASVNSTTSVSLRSGSISGTFDLAEQLTLKTLAGSISAKIHPLNLTTPNAKLTAKTLSGSISLGLKLDDHTPPRRNYSTEVQTVSGSISGLYLFGATTTFAADAGAISVSVLPTLYEERFDTLVTSSQHGATVLGFEKALKGKKVYGIHGTVTGGVEVKYPKDWEGKVIAKAGVGVVDVVGEGIEITRREIGLVEGFKGNKTNGKIVAGSGVGGVLVRVG